MAFNSPARAYIDINVSLVKTVCIFVLIYFPKSLRDLCCELTSRSLLVFQRLPPAVNAHYSCPRAFPASQNLSGNFNKPLSLKKFWIKFVWLRELHTREETSNPRVTHPQPLVTRGTVNPEGSTDALSVCLLLQAVSSQHRIPLSSSKLFK